MVLSTLKTAFGKHPFLANIATVTSLFVTADATCQFMQNKGLSNFDWIRNRNMGSVGLCYYGPLYFYYYRALDRKFPGKSSRAIVTKLLIDTLIFTPPSLTCFYLVMGTFEGKSMEQKTNELKQKFLPTYVTALTFWPAAQCINFTFIPAPLRVVYVSCANFIWLVMLSYIKNQPQLPPILQKIENLTSGSKIEEKQA